MKKSILLAACTLLFAVTTNAQDTKAPAAATPPANVEITFEAEEFNFGTIKQGESVTHEFTFTNTGKENLILTNAQGSCGCTVPVWPKEPIGKGQKGSIKVTFNSAGKMGMQDKTVTITSNAKNSPRVLHLKGTVEMPAAPAPAPDSKEAPKN
jgi:hypothetical protein